MATAIGSSSPRRRGSRASCFAATSRQRHARPGRGAMATASVTVLRTASGFPALDGLAAARRNLLRVWLQAAKRSVRTGAASQRTKAARPSTAGAWALFAPQPARAQLCREVEARHDTEPRRRSDFDLGDSALGAGHCDRPAKKKAGSHRPRETTGSACYFTCLPIRPAISNIETWALPKISRSFASAFTMRLFIASCSLFFLM
jgi:hypothetical protein